MPDPCGRAFSFVRDKWKLPPVSRIRVRELCGVSRSKGNDLIFIWGLFLFKKARGESNKSVAPKGQQKRASEVEGLCTPKEKVYKNSLLNKREFFGKFIG